MSRRLWIQIDGRLVEVSSDYTQEPTAPLIFGDLPGYQSPVTGLWVEGRKQRREDLKRTGSRPWEGLDQEKKELARQEDYKEKQLDASLTKSVSEAFYQLPPEKRDILRRI